MMKKEDIEKYIATLSPELQEKARACKNMDELKKFLAENDVELPEDVLQAVSGGCELSSDVYNTGDLVVGVICGDCGGPLYYWDMLWNGPTDVYDIIRMYCDNPACKSYKNGLWCARGDKYQKVPVTNVCKWS